MDRSELVVYVANSVGESDAVSASAGGVDVMPVSRSEFVPGVRRHLESGGRDRYRYVVLNSGEYLFRAGWMEAIVGQLGPSTWVVSAPDNWDGVGSGIVAMSVENLLDLGCLHEETSAFGYDRWIEHVVGEADGGMVSDDFVEFVEWFENDLRDEAIGDLYYTMIRDLEGTEKRIVKALRGGTDDV